MNELPHQFREDKALRDAAKAVLEADLAHLKSGIADKGVAGRLREQVTGKVKRRVSAGTRDALTQVKKHAGDHRGLIAVIVGALIMWFGREPLLGWLGLSEQDDFHDDNEDDAGADAMNEAYFAECDADQPLFET